MNYYVDDDTIKGPLMKRLRGAGHSLVLPADVGLSGVSDARHFVYAMRHSLIMLTRNHEHFKDLHEVAQAAAGTHPGIITICSDNDPTRDMTDRGIVNAIAKLERSGAPMPNQLHVLNHWR